MSSARKPDKNKAAKGADARSGEATDAPAWAQGLKQLYDSVVDEPLPDSFKNLLDAFDDGTGPGDDAGTGKPD
ncbi:NepR family anti-sigma factor [uncultured Erythrobacter sp.]|uniref:NepR family anti-sigma factor n=1 Tax=uncultured Erythrobacter sp. TaxID=263913 RepID=UPI00261CE0B4|nr:NepR family anti-sigma factor [uncultured Erythrobacter sp.]